MIVFGTRRTVQQLAMVLLTCAHCHRSAANAVLKLVTKFTLFFIPLFPIRTRYATQCTACGFSMDVDKAGAEQLAQLPPAGSTPQFPQPPYPGAPAYGNGTHGRSGPGR